MAEFIPNGIYGGKKSRQVQKPQKTETKKKTPPITVKHKDIIFGSSPYRPTLLKASLKEEEYTMHVIFDAVLPLASATGLMDFWSDPVQLFSCSKCFMLGNFTDF